MSSSNVTVDAATPGISQISGLLLLIAEAGITNEAIASKLCETIELLAANAANAQSMIEDKRIIAILREAASRHPTDSADAVEWVISAALGALHALAENGVIAS